MLIVFLNRYGNWPDERTRQYPYVSLKSDTWDDYGFRTQFNAIVHVDEDVRVELGNVKIGHSGMEPGMRAVLPDWGGYSDALPEDFFSLGQDAAYYDSLQELAPTLRAAFAISMRDIPLLGIDRSELEEHEVFRVSLLRFSAAMVALDTAYRQHNLERPEPPRYSFTLQAQLSSKGLPHVVPFDFDPASQLPGRINLLVGTNGVGKTQLMARLAVLLSRYVSKATVEGRKAVGESENHPAIDIRHS